MRALTRVHTYDHTIYPTGYDNFIVETRKKASTEHILVTRLKCITTEIESGF